MNDTTFSDIEASFSASTNVDMMRELMLAYIEQLTQVIKKSADQNDDATNDRFACDEIKNQIQALP